MSEKFRVNDLVKFNYSEIVKYVDENHTDRPLRNDEVCDLLNKQQVQIKVYEESLIRKSKKISEQQSTIEQLQKENKQLQKELNNCEKFRYTVFKRIREIW